ncbi:MAG: hypothetical protein ACN4GZ_08055 [Acidimicrobiales bacterium]
MSRNPVIRFPSSSAGEAQTAAEHVEHNIPKVDPNFGGVGTIERRKVKPTSLGVFERG